jgi:hypothetical protein
MSFMPHARHRRLCAAVLSVILVWACGAAAQGLPAASPESLGLSQERLDRLSKAMQGYIDAQRDAGIVTMSCGKARSRSWLRTASATPRPTRR